MGKIIQEHEKNAHAQVDVHEREATLLVPKVRVQ